MQTWNRLFVDQAGATGPSLAACALVAGLIILLLGWRLSQLVAVLDFSLCGALVGASLTAGSELQWLSGGIGAIAFGALALWLDHYSELLVCGLIAGFSAVLLTGLLTPPLGAMLLIAAVAVGCSLAMSSLSQRPASAVTTAVQGGLLSAFGLAACLSYNGQLWWEFKDVLVHYNYAPVLFVLGSICVGVTFQLASIRDEDGLVR